MLGSLLTETTPYASARLLNIVILCFFISGATWCMKGWGYAQGAMTQRGAMTMSLAGVGALVVTYGIICSACWMKEGR
ncbi:hypothetical protein ACWGI1_17815 [Streptomyces sp. NPDC054835]